MSSGVKLRRVAPRGWRGLAAATAFVLVPAGPAAAADADVDVSIAAPESARTGDDVVYRVSVVNRGPDEATGVALTDPLPAETTFQAATTSHGACSGGGTVMCALGSLGRDEVAQVTIRVGATAPGAATNTVSVTSSSPDPDASDQATATTQISGPVCTRVGSADADVLVGGDGADVLCGLGADDVVEGGAGDDVLLGGSGRDASRYASATRGIRVELGPGRATGDGADVLRGVEDVEGSRFDDILRGNARANRLSGAGGRDLLYGHGGPDALLGGGGEDFLHGGSGRDRLEGGAGSDVCVPGRGGGVRRSCASTSPGDGIDRRTGLDVRRVRTALSRRAPQWTLAMRSRWRNGSIEDRGYIVIDLDTMGGDGPDYRILVRSSRSRMRGVLFRVGERGEREVGDLEAWRSSARSVSVRVPRSRLRFGRGRTHYAWEAVTLFTSGRCPQVCFDRVPDEGPLVQPLP